MVNNPLPRRCRAVVKSLGSCLFYEQGMGDRGPKACGPCVALASKECQTGLAILALRLRKVATPQLGNPSGRW